MDIGAHTLKQLSQRSKLPRKALQKLFKKFLFSAPTISIVSKRSAHLLIDTTYFEGNRCVVIYGDNDLRFTQLFRCTDRERYREIREDLKNLSKLGVDIESITCDGHKAMLKAIKEVCPKANIQRCYVHVQRMVKAWLTQYPRLPASKQLRFRCGLIHHIKSPVEQQMWTIAINSWYQQNQTIINEKVFNPYSGRWWYKHKKLRQSASMVIHALPDLFHHINNPSIPGTTNALESFFAHLKGHLNVHRGLSYKNKMNYIKWYLHFKNNQH